MNDHSFHDKPVFDKDYCDAYGITADWFKFDKTTAGYLMALVNESTNDNGEWILEDVSWLGYTMYAICCQLMDCDIPPRLESILKQKNMKLAKLAFDNCSREIEDSRSRIAENRYNGSKGGNARGKNQQ
jgi:hypothetical protein